MKRRLVREEKRRDNYHTQAAKEKEHGHIKIRSDQIMDGLLIIAQY